MELITNSTGNWNIYRIIEDNDAFIFRFPIFNSSDTKLDTYISKHVLIQSIGLPTLKIVQKCKLMEDTV